MEKSNLLEFQAMLGMVIPFIFLLTITYFGFLWQDYNPWRMTISELGSNLSPFRSMVSVIFILTGGSIMLFGAGLHNATKSHIFSAGILVIIFGLFDLILSGFFPTDGKGAPISFPGLIHSLCSFVGDIALILAPFLFLLEIEKNSEWRKFKILTLMVSIIGIVLFTTYFLFRWFTFDLNLIPFGFLQRVIITVYFIWFFFLAFNLLLLSKKKGIILSR